MSKNSVLKSGVKKFFFLIITGSRIQLREILSGIKGRRNRQAYGYQPQLEIEAAGRILAQAFNSVYRLEVDSFMLVERVNATVDGHNVPSMKWISTFIPSSCILSCRFSNRAGEETFPCPMNTASAGQFYIFRINFFPTQN